LTRLRDATRIAPVHLPLPRDLQAGSQVSGPVTVTAAPLLLGEAVPLQRARPKSPPPGVHRRVMALGHLSVPRPSRQGSASTSGGSRIPSSVNMLAVSPAAAVAPREWPRASGSLDTRRWSSAVSPIQHFSERSSARAPRDLPTHVARSQGRDMLRTCRRYHQSCPKFPGRRQPRPRAGNAPIADA